jgi:hypothetical protein
MDVGNDPFPRDEVTGLAAFENLEPVKAINVAPPEQPDSTPAPAAQPAPARTFGRPIGVSPASAARSGGFENDRADKTEILNLDKVEHVTEESNEGGWDDDEATSILTPAAFRLNPSASHATSAPPPAASLDMDWDEEEPPTRMRDDMTFLPPLSGSRTSPGVAPGAWGAPPDDAGQDPMPRYDDLASAGYAPVPELSTPNPPVGRPSPFPTAAQSSNYLPPIVEPMADRGGAPSPFSATRAPALGMAGKPAWMLVAAGAGVAIVLLLIGRALFGSSAPDGSVTVATTPSDARVYIDGRPVSGTSSPYSANELKEGPHELVVQKDGFTEHRTTFNLEDGETRALPAVELTAKAVQAGFAINSMPSGAAIWIDDSATGHTTPAKITGIAPGVHKLQLQLPGHTRFELQVLVPETGILQLPTAELAPAEVAAAAPSRSRSEREPREVREPREPREPRESSSSSSGERRRSRSDAVSDAPIATRAEPAAPRGGGGNGGMLRLNSRPWSQVYVDGKLVGNTPQMGLPLSPGSHSIRLVNAQMGLTKTFSVSVKQGQMVTKVVNLVE